MSSSVCVWSMHFSINALSPTCFTSHHNAFFFSYFAWLCSCWVERYTRHLFHCWQLKSFLYTLFTIVQNMSRQISVSYDRKLPPCVGIFFWTSLLTSPDNLQWHSTSWMKPIKQNGNHDVYIPLEFLSILSRASPCFLSTGNVGNIRKTAPPPPTPPAPLLVLLHH